MGQIHSPLSGRVVPPLRSLSPMRPMRHVIFQAYDQAGSGPGIGAIGTRLRSTNLRDLGFPESIDDGVLIVSELVTNAVRNAPQTPCSVTVRVAVGRAVIEVYDYSAELPQMREPDVVSEHGRGLHVVGELCEGWDCVQSGGGKAVIAILPRKAHQNRPKRLSKRR
jgi:anti-sigma regulatory factor (Ser/Thr protein kinase)